jgi:hypothetical protein
MLTKGQVLLIASFVARANRRTLMARTFASSNAFCRYLNNRPSVFSLRTSIVGLRAMGAGLDCPGGLVY